MKTIDITRVACFLSNRAEFKPTGNRWWPAALFLLALCAAPLHAQFGASLAGTVLDSSGAAISGATVTLTNSATQQKQVDTSNATGFYHFN
jgi:hypothetical protein